jgi:hypothetical protein
VDKAFSSRLNLCLLHAQLPRRHAPSRADRCESQHAQNLCQPKSFGGLLLDMGAQCVHGCLMTNNSFLICFHALGKWGMARAVHMCWGFIEEMAVES